MYIISNSLELLITCFAKAIFTRKWQRKVHLWKTLSWGIYL